jgi:hypothetical protein
MPEIATGVNGIVREGLRRVPQILRCRFTIGAGLCHATMAPPYCRHLEQAMYEASARFIADMERLYRCEWQGRMALAGGPYPVTQVATSVPKAPARKKGRLGPRSTAPDIYPEGVVFDVPTIAMTDGWEYELAGAFVRLLPPTEVLETDKPVIEARTAARRSRRGRR